MESIPGGAVDESQIRDAQADESLSLLSIAGIFFNFLKTQRGSVPKWLRR